MDFITDRLESGQTFRTLAVVDQCTRGCLVLEPAQSLTAAKVVHALDRVAEQRGYPKSITVDNGSGFSSRIMNGWAYELGLKLDFIRLGKPVENGFIERLPAPRRRCPWGCLWQASLSARINGRFKDECLNVELFWSIEDT